MRWRDYCSKEYLVGASILIRLRVLRMWQRWMNELQSWWCWFLFTFMYPIELDSCLVTTILPNAMQLLSIDVNTLRPFLRTQWHAGCPSLILSQDVWRKIMLPQSGSYRIQCRVRFGRHLSHIDIGIDPRLNAEVHLPPHKCWNRARKQRMWITPRDVHESFHSDQK